MTDVAQQVRQFIVDSFLFGQADQPLGEDDSFLDQGLIDSTGVLELVTFLETTFGISIHDDELIPDNLDSLNRVVRFVESKLGAASVAV